MHRAGALFLLALSLLLAPPSAMGQEKIIYPAVNLAATFEVEAGWPKKPSEFYWGAVSGIAVDAKDHVYVFTRGEPPVQVYDTSGKLLRSWGKGIGSSHHIKIDFAGHVWISDIDKHVVEKYTPEGKLLLTLGVKGTAGRDKKHFNMPTDMAVTAKGDVYVSDGYGNARVVHFDKDGKYVGEWGELGHGPGQFSIAHAIAVDSKGRVYVADRNNVRVQVFSPQGKFLDEWRDLIVPWGFHVTAKDEIWVCGSSPMQWRKGEEGLGCPPKDQIFMKFDPSGRVRQLFTLPKGLDGLERPGEVNWVHAMALDSRGNMYLGDIIGRRAQKFLLKNP
jgi:NHL repeat